MSDITINLLDEINSLSKIHTLKRNDIDNLMVEFAQRITATLHIERMSVWLFNETKDAVISMGEYDMEERQFNKNNILKKNKYPSYFKAISENEILLIENVNTNKNTIELKDDYSIPNHIISLMDIPLRIEGELVGIMCYEKKGIKEKVFTKQEQLFALSVSLVFASNLEARQRRAFQYRLNHELKEKDILVKEINHRVKNNLAVISSLINLQANKSKDQFHKGLFDECRSKIDTIAEIHAIMYKSENFHEVNSQEYLGRLLDNLNAFYADNSKKVEIKYNIEAINLQVEHTVPLSLIINEVVTNSYKHAFKENSNNGKIIITLKRKGSQVILTIQDNGNGFDPKLIINSDSLGMDIIKGLVQQLDGEYAFENKGGTTFKLLFKVHESPSVLDVKKLADKSSV